MIKSLRSSDDSAVRVSEYEYFHKEKKTAHSSCITILPSSDIFKKCIHLHRGFVKHVLKLDVVASPGDITPE